MWQFHYHRKQFDINNRHTKYANSIDTGSNTDDLYDKFCGDKDSNRYRQREIGDHSDQREWHDSILLYARYGYCCGLYGWMRLNMASVTLLRLRCADIRNDAFGNAYSRQQRQW